MARFLNAVFKIAGVFFPFLFLLQAFCPTLCAPEFRTNSIALHGKASDFAEERENQEQQKEPGSPLSSIISQGCMQSQGSAGSTVWVCISMQVLEA